MNKQYADSRYETERFDDRLAGCAGLRLYRERQGRRELVAEVTFWDAVGQFFFRTLGDQDIEVELALEVIQEAKATIPTR